MKYIIPENKIDKIIFKYLDLNLKGLEKRKARYHNGIVYGFPDEKFGILGYENGDTLHIYYELINEISSVFGLKEIDSQSVIGRWVSDRLQLEVINTTRAIHQRGTLRYR
jgi:hypothetical protein